MATRTSRYQPPADQRELVLAWIRRSRESQLSHYEMATILQHRNRGLGLPAIIISTAIGTSALASISEVTVSNWLKIAVGLLSILAAVLSSLQTFFKYSERAEEHRVFGAKFGAVRRELEAFHASSEFSDDSRVSALREKLDHLAELAPAVPERIFSRIQRQGVFVANED